MHFVATKIKTCFPKKFFYKFGAYAKLFLELFSSSQNSSNEVKIKYNIQKLFIPLIFSILFFSGGCQVANRIVKEVEKTQNPQIINGTDNRAQITVPGNWQKRTDLHDEAEIQAANLLKEQYVIVISESNIDFSDDMTLKDFTELIIGTSKETVKDGVITEVTSIKVDGYDAKQFELSKRTK